MARLKKLFLTPMNPSFMNKMVGIILIAFSVLNGISFVLNYFFYHIAGKFMMDSSRTMFDLIYPLLRNIFKPEIIFLLAILILLSFVDGILLLMKKEIGRLVFLFLNAMFIFDTIFFNLQFYSAIKDLILTILPPSQVGSYMNQTLFAMGIIGLIFIGIHAWAIWRYAQPDMKELFN